MYVRFNTPRLRHVHTTKGLKDKKEIYTYIHKISSCLSDSYSEWWAICSDYHQMQCEQAEEPGQSGMAQLLGPLHIRDPGIWIQLTNLGFIWVYWTGYACSHAVTGHWVRIELKRLLVSSETVVPVQYRPIWADSRCRRKEGWVRRTWSISQK